MALGVHGHVGALHACMCVASTLPHAAPLQTPNPHTPPRAAPAPPCKCRFAPGIAPPCIALPLPRTCKLHDAPRHGHGPAHDADADCERRVAVRKVGGAVQRVHAPAECRTHAVHAGSETQNTHTGAGPKPTMAVTRDRCHGSPSQPSACAQTQATRSAGLVVAIAGSHCMASTAHACRTRLCICVCICVRVRARVIAIDCQRGWEGIPYACSWLPHTTSPTPLAQTRTTGMGWPCFRSRPPPPQAARGRGSVAVGSAGPCGTCDGLRGGGAGVETSCRNGRGTVTHSGPLQAMPAPRHPCLQRTHARQARPMSLLLSAARRPAPSTRPAPDDRLSRLPGRQ